MGGGSQSSAILQLYLDNKVDLDFIIFSDTGLEPSYVYHQINDWLKEEKIRKIFYRAESEKNMFHMLTNYINGTRKSIRMFVYTFNPKTNHYGAHPKTCTGSYKIAPNKSVVNQLIRLKLKCRKIPKDIIQHTYIGYSQDEIHRAKKMAKFETENIKYFFPLISKNMNFVKTIQYLKKNNRSIKRSACFMCPLRNDSVQGMGWIDVLKDDYINFEKLIKYDVNIRNCPNSRKFEYHLYLDTTCIPLWILYGFKWNGKDSLQNWQKWEKTNKVNDWLLDYCQKKDKKGKQDLTIKNRRWKRVRARLCGESTVGACSL